MAKKNSRQEFVTSADGTSIAVRITGSGPAVVICPGSLPLQNDWAGVAEALAPDITTFVIDRRGHGASGDADGHSLEREQEDVLAVLRQAGADATLLGASYGGVVSLGLSLKNPPAKLILYEPPVAVSGPIGGEGLAAYDEAIATGDLDAALELGLRVFLGVPAEALPAFRAMPDWSARAKEAPAWSRELKAVDDFGGDLDRFANLKMPVLALVGTQSPPWLVDVTKRIGKVVPNLAITELQGQAHDAYAHAPAEVAQAIKNFVLG